MASEVAAVLLLLVGHVTVRELFLLGQAALWCGGARAGVGVRLLPALCTRDGRRRDSGGRPVPAEVTEGQRLALPAGHRAPDYWQRISDSDTSTNPEIT